MEEGRKGRAGTKGHFRNRHAYLFVLVRIQSLRKYRAVAQRSGVVTITALETQTTMAKKAAEKKATDGKKAGDKKGGKGAGAAEDGAEKGGKVGVLLI